MNSASKLFVTIIVWGCITGISIASLITMAREDPLFSLIICAVALAAATITTSQIWTASINPETQSEKIKRQSRVEQMLKQMDERDLEELRARLSEGDGETVTLEELLEQRSRR